MLNFRSGVPFEIHPWKAYIQTIAFSTEFQIELEMVLFEDMFWPVDRFDLCNLLTFLIWFCHESSSHNFPSYIDPIWFLDTFHLPFSFSPEYSEIQFMFIHIKSLTWCLGSLTSVFNQKKCVVNLKKKIKCKSLKEF